MKFKLNRLIVLIVLCFLVLFLWGLLFSWQNISGKAIDFQAKTESKILMNVNDFLSVNGLNDFEGRTLALIFKGINQETNNASFTLNECLQESNGVCIKASDKVLKIIDVRENSSISALLLNVKLQRLIKEEVFLNKINLSNNPSIEIILID